MPVTPDRKLDVLGVVLAVLVVLGAGLAVFGAIEASGGGGDDVQIDFTVERINDTHVRVVHAGGDVVEGADLSITIDGRDRVPTVERFPERASEGDVAVMQVNEGHTLRVFYHGGLGAPQPLDDAET